MIIKVWYWSGHCSPSCHVSWDTCDPVLTNIKSCSVKLSWVTLSDWWHGNWPLLTKIRDLTMTQCSCINHWHWDSSLHLQNLTNDNTPDLPALQLYLSLQARAKFYASLAFNATLAFSVVTAPSVLAGYLCVSDVSLCLRSLMSRSPAAVFTALSSVATHPPLWSHLSHLCTNTPVTNHTNMFWQQLETVKHVNMSCDQL